MREDLQELRKKYLDTDTKVVMLIYEVETLIKENKWLKFWDLFYWIGFTIFATIGFVKSFK